ncbi:MAG: N-acetyltransferase [Chloroflexota bacterium]|nr:N-acetyltransferase [Chloroflexota bacterium]|tara:strand:+ start:919 stop:1362 length:444 start_codon:yes stop_codon:yes gene_type:complete
MKNNLKIRKANKNDISGLNTLNSRSFEEITKKLDFSKFIDNSNYRIIIASKKKDIVGYLLTLKLANNLHEIISIAVDSSHKREGVASSLLSEFLVKEKVNSKVILEVANKNKAAIKLYKTFLFGVDGVRKDYYKDPPDDALLMSKII